MNKTCFVISPIGEKGSDIRERADALYDLIIEPALEKFGFVVTRADKNTSVSSITSEIVQLVQESGLCIIDISGHNPNVMYECGRRHETAKPYIMMAAEGEKLPFDINTIRTIFYNLDNAREIRNTVKTLQSIIEKMLESGLEPERSGESLSTLSDTLSRIERKVDRLSTTGGRIGAESPANTYNSTYQEILSSLGLNGAFTYALSQGDIGLAEFLMPNLERQLPLERYVDLVLTQAAPMGSIIAHQKLIDLFDTIETYDHQLKKDIIASLVAGFNLQDREREGIALMTPFFNEIIDTETPTPELSDKDKAFYLNQFGRLLHGAEEFEKALEIGKTVVGLAPDDLSYIYNYSILCEKTGSVQEAYKVIRKLYAIMKNGDKYDDDHLSRVVKLFAQNNDTDIHEAFSKLQEINPYMATMLLRDNKIKNALKG
jgi:tetratricopeptide (TPR) repeat protein